MKSELMKLGSNRAGVMLLSNGQRACYGSIRVEKEHFVHYTGLGLKEMWPQNVKETEKSKALKLQGESELVELGHIAKIPIVDIVRLLS